ncbi:MAG: amidohydrolase family protein [Clostridiaceae bacterium]|nr:amidohydrolase family protein [Clostridiaceae bacterium]
MNQKVYDAEYERDLLKYFDGLLPVKIYDAHFHLSRDYTQRSGYQGAPFMQYTEFMEKYLGRHISGGMVMPSPSSKHTAETLADENAYNLTVAEEHNLEAGLIVTPGCGREATEKKLEKFPRIRVLKPYFCYSLKENTFESDILDFAPEWMWSLAHDRKMPILVHLSHYQNMLNDPQNWGQIRYLCEKYPDAKLILAHCAMGHHVRKLRLGLEHISDLKNIWLDCSGSAETMSIYYCLKTFGVNRMLYGGDYYYAATIGRICSFGSNFIGFHLGYVKEEAIPGDYKYQPLNNGQECLLALLEACELLQLSRKDMEKIFYDNAAQLFC